MEYEKTDKFLIATISELSEGLKDVIRDSFSAICHGEQNSLTGRGKEDQDVQEGLDYLSRAVELGSADAECELYRLYHNGRWVDKDEELARQWLDQAAAHGSRQAKMIKESGAFLRDIQRAHKAQQLMVRTSRPVLLPPGFDLQQEQKILPTLSPATEKVGRNALCPCESGKKYKKCCGSS
jgi:TPR repeat protein